MRYKRIHVMYLYILCRVQSRVMPPRLDASTISWIFFTKGQQREVICLRLNSSIDSLTNSRATGELKRHYVMLKVLKSKNAIGGKTFERRSIVCRFYNVFGLSPFITHSFSKILFRNWVRLRNCLAKGQIACDFRCRDPHHHGDSLLC